MKTLTYCLGCLFAFTIFQSCNTSISKTSTPPTSAQQLYTQFRPWTNATDTIPMQLDSILFDSSQTVSPQLFIAALDSALIESMYYEPDTFDFRAQAYWAIPLDEDRDACLLDLGQLWFKFKYLLIYSKSAQQFVGIEPAAYFYGGDGGQITRESWLFNLSTTPTLFSGYLEHYLKYVEEQDDMVSTTSKKVGLQQWTDSTFQTIPLQDSAFWLRKYVLYGE